MPATITVTVPGTNYANYAGTYSFDEAGLVNVISMRYPSVSTYADVFVDNIVSIMFGFLVVIVIIVFVGFYLGIFKGLE
jgi:hypothetical protein